MAGLLDSLATINSLIRTVLSLLLVAVLGTAGWFAWHTIRSGERDALQSQAALADAREELAEFARQLEGSERDLAEARAHIGRQAASLLEQERQIGDLQRDVQEKQQRIDRLDTAMRLLKVDHRVARLTVLEQGRDAGGSVRTSRVEFVEVDELGRALGEPRVFQIEGDVVYVDYWIVKFDEKFVEEADLHRSTSLVLFRRLFGEYQEPMQGFELDAAGSRPVVYARGTVPGGFEEQIWSDFWAIANDPARAAALGIRAAHGEAVSMRLTQGGRYRLLLRASDGLTITPE